MGEIVGAGLLSHAPTIMMNKEQRYALNDGKEISLVPGLNEIRKKVIEPLQPDVVIVIDTHWFTIVEFIVSSHKRRKGFYTSDELPRTMDSIPFDINGNPELANNIAECVSNNGVRCSSNNNEHLPIHYPTINMLEFLQGDEQWLSMSICATAKKEQFIRVGRGLREAIEESNKRVVILASGGLSHKFWPLGELEQHEASDPIHVLTREAREADEARIEWLKNGDHKSVYDGMEDYYQFSPEGKFGHYLIMAEAIGGVDCKAKGQQFGDYENATGTGQVHLWFDRPASGWK